ncbi:MAG: hypothetical protein KJ970_03140 [Candidatus Eisenbacteria bacterium]|uniref:Uncharacterized protein n=1 Tax=Eiseniibacteriota bacterium TaxID=2212470 RepID=A0A948RTW4_UNCEI|nr:hypothetical protein [Candidatus Eisenbacteria bacterium]
MTISAQAVAAKQSSLKSPPQPAWEDVLCLCRSAKTGDGTNDPVSFLASGRPKKPGLVEPGPFEALLQTRAGLWFGGLSLNPLDLGFVRRALEFLDVRTEDFYLACGTAHEFPEITDEKRNTQVSLTLVDTNRLYKEIRPLYNRPLEIDVVEAETAQPVEFAKITIKRISEVGFSEHFRCCEALDWAKVKFLGPKIRELTTDAAGLFVEALSDTASYLTTPAKHSIHVEAIGYHPINKILWFYKKNDPIRLHVELYRAASFQDPPPIGTITKIETE